MNETLVDSSFVYALYSTKDKKHVQALEFSQQDATRLVVPDVILPEVTFLFQGGEAIMRTYASAELDFVDCAVMALAERLNIKQVLTYDRRDFGIVRPAHCEFLTLLP